MAKRMPLPPEPSTEPQGSTPMPGFAGVISKIPIPPRRFTEAPSSEPESAEVKGVEREVTTNTQDPTSEMEIAIDRIDISPFQPRLKIDEDELRMLAESIDADGQINPVVVRQKHDARFELIGGERRWRAMQLLKRSSIRVIVKDLSDADTAVMAVADNDARQDLADFERGRKYKQLLDEKFVSSQSELARRIGRERTFVVKCLAFFRLPVEVIPLLEQRPGFLGAVNAGVFAAYMERNDGKDADLILEAIRKIYENKLDAVNAINWLKGQVRVRYYPPLLPDHHVWTVDGKRLGEMTIEGRKLVIACADGVTPDELLTTILAVKQGKN